MTAEGQVVMTQQFNRGDLVRNVNPRSRYYGMVGTFHHERMSDLVLVRESEAA